MQKVDIKIIQNKITNKIPKIQQVKIAKAGPIHSWLKLQAQNRYNKSHCKRIGQTTHIA